MSELVNRAKLLKLIEKVKDADKQLYNIDRMSNHEDHDLKRALWIVYNLWTSEEYTAIEEYLRSKGAKSALDVKKVEA